MRMVVDVTDLPDLELLAVAAEAVASQRRVAVELASVELQQAKATGEDVRTRALRVVDMLGDAGRLVELAGALRAAAPLDVVRPGPTVAAFTSPASFPAAVNVAVGATGPGQTLTGPHSAASAPAAPVSTEPEPSDSQAAETLANLRKAGESALGPDAGHAPAAAESSEVPDLVTP